MRARLLLSVAITALSLGMPQSYAQNPARDQPGGEPQKPAQAEPAARPQKPDEQGARERRGEMQSRERGEAKGEREAASPGANESAEKAARQEERHPEQRGAAVKHGEKKGEKHGAANENLDRTPGAQTERRREHGAKQTPGGQPGAETRGSKAETQGAKEAEKQDKTGRAGSAATENERRGERAAGAEERSRSATEQRTPGAEQRAPSAAERAPGQERTGEETKRGAEATQGGRVQGRETYGYAGREAQRGGVQLDARQESRVRDIIEQRGGRRISRTDFDVRIGAIAPPSVAFAPLPPEVVSIVPQYRGFDYVMVEDQIAIIDPNDRRVVSMLDVGGGPMPGGPAYEERGGRYGGGAYERRDGGRQAQRGGYGRRERGGEAYGYAPRVRLDARQERTLYRGVMRQARENLRQVCVHVGDRVPDYVDLAPVPRNVALDAPDVERYDYFVLNDQVVLVDPDSHVVVDIIEEPR
ncbi:DUF1236 domain-containing protein [Methylocystis sp. JR02]|uniref:DUF1236 domain-containing protein n=1 Tax=Methylocystis sp. JR02 TaxID=3046284 RepID=UPI0024B994B6|nr:DUF1236 domain-containing protein [Methylocystis sp. JR02]MDJ0447498.1 DUF1236 domain-containing protein [Methylocystis sp. JR02]